MALKIFIERAGHPVGGILRSGQKPDHSAGHYYPDDLPKNLPLVKVACNDVAAGLTAIPDCMRNNTGHYVKVTA
jgi:hypothetical protein